ncbi:MAG: PAS domain-containing protein, partial [Myxococcales bacterium]|nr:PAS domain-containing protein [Myxococcales bacterium]
MPASLLVNERRELVHAFGGAGRFVRVRDGRPSLDLLDLVEPDLKMALAGALQRALKEREPIVYQGVRLNLDGKEASYKLSVRPVHPKTVTMPHLLISIERSNQQAPEPPSERHFDAGQVSRDQVENLENELRYTKENLQATIEEVETSNEELQATNEELLAANEELQSTNEELQSVNEELFTVNAEYQKKIAQLTELTNDMDNLLLSTDVGTIFLDEHLKIRKFTPRIAQTFDLLPHDIGRPLANFSNNLDHPNLIKDLAEVVRTGAVVEREARDPAGNWFFLRLLPYRAAGMSRGAVLTLVDMNGLKAAEDELFRERYLLESLMDGVPDLIYFKDARGRFVRVNQAMALRLGIDDPQAATGKRATDFVTDAVAKGVDGQDDAALRGEGQPYRLERQTSPEGHTQWFMTTRQPLRDREGQVVGMYAILRDVTEQKHAEDEIRSAVTRRDQFLAMLSHELRNPLGAVVTASRLLAEQCKDAAVPRELAIIERQSHQMARLLDDLLESNRFTQNKIELAHEVVDVRAIVDEAAGVLAEGFQKAKLELHLDVGEGQLSVDGDSARIQQV